MTQTLHGLAAAPGIGMGTLFLYRPGVALPQATATTRTAVDPRVEWAFFRDAQARVDTELEHLGANAGSLLAEIFAAHRVMLHDKTLLDSIHNAIFDQRLDAATATHQVITELGDLFQSFEDEYFAGRAVDIVDLGHRLLVQMGAALSRTQLTQLPAETILAAEDLSPSELAQIPPDTVLGIALARSTPTAHSAILARGMGIPLVCTLGPNLLHLLPGQEAIVDGNKGLFLFEIDADHRERYQAARHAFLEEGAAALSHATESAVTQDGKEVPVLANANSPQEVADSCAGGADGIGLLRTEYLFRGRDRPPSLEEQTQTYHEFIRQVRRQLTVRALDAGGDKPVDYIVHHREDNPFLGLRGVRLLLAEPHLLDTQYRALQAASALSESDVDVRFMLPMISTYEEFQAARELLARADDETGRPPLKLGIMIEVPSAALIAHTLAPHVDFFSIGTNDLAQYVLATDRTNSSVAKMADPLHPAVLKLIQSTCNAARMYGKPVSLCGEIAGEPLATPVLIGLGVTELSAPLPAVPLIKSTIRKLDMELCRQLASAALQCSSAADVRRRLAQG